MVADEIKQLTSEQQMRTLQFNDKVSRLNREFIKQLQEWFKQCPHYDFSNSVKSYLEHMKRLDEIYSGKPTSNGKVTRSETPTNSTTTRVIAKARRRIRRSENNNDLNNSVSVSTPSGAPPRLSIGSDVSIIKPSADVTLTVPTPKANEPSSTNAAAAGGRKRAIRGGGPAGGAETVVFRGSDAPAVSSKSAPLLTTTLPKPTPGFWSSQKKDEESNDSAKPSFSFGAAAKTKATDSSDQDNNFLKVPPVTFGNGRPLSFGNKEDDKEKSTSSSGGDKKDDSNSEKKPFSSFSFGEKVGSSSKEKPTLSFPTFGAKKDGDSSEEKTPLTFPSFGAKQESGSSESKAALSFPSFGSSTSTSAPSAGLQFSFGALPKSSTEGKEEEKAGDEEEYVPPVESDEWYLSKEPGSTYTSKCALFQLVDKQYNKLGVGRLYLKENDGKHTILVRAGNSVGTPLMNVLISKAMKVVKADEKGEKLRLFCPVSDKEISTYLIRFPSNNEASKVLEKIEDVNK